MTFQVLIGGFTHTRYGDDGWTICVECTTTWPCDTIAELEENG